ncbi:MAG: exodeoxyribonuclease VII large subunit, partial [Rhodothermales bacterium]|nr:exodeoxyribonuclease VII large subunit [Rhodothermales bacterium]
MNEKFAADPLTVTELVGRIRSTLREQIGLVRVDGELSNVSRPTSGHCYFTLKDENSQIRCVMFRSDMRRLAFAPQDGMRVIVTGHTDVYQTRGTLQIRALSMAAAGEGALQKAFEVLKKKLMEEGLFDVGRKRPLPRFPRRIALITSPTGAAIQDLLQILERRYPLVEVVVCPVQVQGVSAATEIARTLSLVNGLSSRSDDHRIDAIIVGRGGGSAEDLWAFNEEIVARAIYGSAIPVVSAVGHETDFSIADFVAD